jgi:uncharacterized protein (DUF433 family)
MRRRHGWGHPSARGRLKNRKQQKRNAGSFHCGGKCASPWWWRTKEQATANATTSSFDYEFDLNELLFIKFLSEFPFSLPKQDKDSLRQLLAKSAGSAGRWQMRGPDLLIKKGELSVSVHYRPLRKQLFQNVSLDRKGLNRIVSSLETLGGEPVFKGTRIPLEHIAGLFRKGVSKTEIREDYPSLSDLDLAFASIHARMSPPPSRPRKPLELGRGKAT